MSGWASQKSRQPLSFPRFSRAWWTNLNRCRKSDMQLGHAEVSPIFRESAPSSVLPSCVLVPRHFRDDILSALAARPRTHDWELLTRDSSLLLSNVLSTKCKLPTRARHFLSFSAALSQLFSHPNSLGDGRDCLAVGGTAHNAFMCALPHSQRREVVSPPAHPAQALKSGLDQHALDGWCAQSSPHLVVSDGRS